LAGARLQSSETRSRWSTRFSLETVPRRAASQHARCCASSRTIGAVATFIGAMVARVCQPGLARLAWMGRACQRRASLGCACEASPLIGVKSDHIGMPAPRQVAARTSAANLAGKVANFKPARPKRRRLTCFRLYKQADVSTSEMQEVQMGEPARNPGAVSELCPIKPDDVVPLYPQIKESLALQITSGGWRPGEELRSEADLCHVFGMSRDTIRVQFTVRVPMTVSTPVFPAELAGKKGLEDLSGQTIYAILEEKFYSLVRQRGSPQHRRRSSPPIPPLQHARRALQVSDRLPLRARRGCASWHREPSFSASRRIQSACRC
jgi:hypothetical protein